MDQKRKEMFLQKRAAYNNEMNRLDSAIQESEKKAEHWKKEGDRIYDLLDNPEQIIQELAAEFKNQTTFDVQDFAFLFLATALQCCRWMLQPKIETSFEKVPNSERHNAGDDGRREIKDGREFAKEMKDDVIKSRRHPDVAQIMLLPVPYDVMKGTNRIVIPGLSKAGVQLTGTNHHAATLGHMPIIGYIFGTLNILTRTVTFNNPGWQTCEVHLTRQTYINPYKYSGQYVTKDIPLMEVWNEAMESLQEDKVRLFAAILKCQLHMQSDKYCKQGLPIPFLSAERAQSLLKQGWNSHELERLGKLLKRDIAVIGKQAVLSILINAIIEFLFQLCNENKCDKQIMEVKSRKIILYSNVLASSSNIIYTLISDNLNNFDVGGFAVTLYRIATDTKIIQQIRDEFVYGGYEKELRLKEYREAEDEY